MRLVKLAGAVILVALALTAMAAATASAVFPEFLPASGKFIALSKVDKLQVDKRGLVECKKGKATGGITGAKTFTALLTLEECTALGLAAKTSGDGSGTVLIPVDGQLCFLKSASPLEVGAEVTILPTGSGVTIEIPSVGQKLVVTGLAIADVTPINFSQNTGSLTFELKDAEGLQKVKNCQGGNETELKVSENGGAVLAAGVELKEEIKFAGNTEVMG